jgi:predicted metal-dependent enzyme (double-stranded beta helix superfamily)
MEIARERCETLLANGVELRDEFRVVVPGQYSRNLVYRDPRGLFVVLALLWKPETVSPVHDHASWGIMGTLESTIEITNFDRVDDRSDPGMAHLKEREVLDSSAGCVQVVDPPFVDIHRMQNPTGRQTITLHTYGREVDACSVYDLKTGKMGSVSLRYANRPGEVPGPAKP